jgi:cytochrome c551/c552
VFLEIPNMQPAHQYLVRCAIAAADGAAIDQEFSYTIHAIGPQRMDEASLHRPAQESVLPPQLTSNLRQGLILRIAQIEGQSALRDSRRVRMAAWRLPETSPTTPRLAPGGFTAKAEGYLQIRQPGRYRFSLSGSGDATLRIDAQDLLTARLAEEPSGAAEIRLGAGHHRMEIDYRSPPRGDASLRLLWTSDHFGSEPVPPEILFHDAGDEELLASDRRYLGREVFESHRCASCHTLMQNTANSSTVVAAPAPDAPQLRGASERLRHDWVAAWIENPGAVRGDATMPALLTSRSAGERIRDAADLAAFVLTLASDEAEPRDTALPGEAWERVERADAALADRGEILYEQFACMACHRLSPPGAADEHDRVSLHFVAAKFTPGGLVGFLQKPDRHFPSTRMPDYRLSSEEAAALAAHLLRATSAHVVNPSVEGDAHRGRELYASVGCANCHPVEGIEPVPTTAIVGGASGSIFGGCLAGQHEPRDKAPAFRFTSDERDAIAAFMQSDGRSLGLTSPLESAALLVRQLRCAACHDRDTHLAPRTALVAEEGVTGQAPEALPSLTWTGEKLRTDWLAAFLAGQKTSPRPWMKARMPHYPYYARALAEGLAAEHAMAHETAGRSAPLDGALVDIGRRLTLETALDCRQCHGIGPIAPRGDERTLSSPGVNFADSRLRLRRAFFLRLLRDPLRVDPATKMPRLAEAGRTKFTQLLGGDAEKQFGAIWAYMQSLEDPDSIPIAPPPHGHP